MQKNCGTEALYEKKVAADGKFFFNLGRRQAIGASPMYATEQDRDAAIAAVKACAKAAVHGERLMAQPRLRLRF